MSATDIRTLGPTPAPGPTPEAGPRHVRVLVVGAGFSGLGMAKALRDLGLSDFLVLERGETVGGTWRDNTYPGCGCDVASRLYSFSWAPNPDWSRSFSRQPEILAYLERVAREHDLMRHVLLRTEALGATWDDAAARWRVRTSAGEYTADVLVGAAGPLSQPQIPDIPGLDTFPGPAFHTARWRHDVDLSDARVAVVGTGASVVQVVPAIQPQVASLTLFQRTAPWVLPKGDRAVGARVRELYRRLPITQKVPRLANYGWRESLGVGMWAAPPLTMSAELVSRAHLRAQVKDPQLRRLLTPRYRLGCKRVLPSNDYYPALCRPNVHLVPEALSGVDGSVVIGADGSRHEVDAIIFGTGFNTADLRVGDLIFGAEGRSLTEVWAQQGRSALRATTVAGFPNLFLLLGPNSGLGHSSMVYQIESQTTYVADAVATMTARRLAAIEPRQEQQSDFNSRLQRRMQRTVWQTGGCSSWYLDQDGRNTTLWPSSTLAFRWSTRSVDLAEYHLRELDPAVHAARETPHPLTRSAAR